MPGRKVGRVNFLLIDISDDLPRISALPRSTAIMMRLRLALTALISLWVAAVSSLDMARAGEAATLTRQFLEAGTLEEGERVLTTRLTAGNGDDEARFGLGMIRFARAIEAFSQHHYRYGLQPSVGDIYPFLRMPVPDNPEPQRLTYDSQRAALQGFLDGLAASEAALAPIGKSDVKIVLDLEKVGLNLTGTPEGAEATLMEILRAISFIAPPDVFLAPDAPQPVAPDAAPKPVFEVAFDRADAIWLKGYCRLLSAALETILAYDWSVTFDRAAGLFYPHLNTDSDPIPSDYDSLLGGPGSAAVIADTLAMLHEIRWPLAEPARMRKARENLKAVVAASRESWAAILAEADDDREWIPAPRQKSAALPGMAITQERVDVWLAAMDDFDAVLDGRKLVPHWRMAQGMNLRRVFEEPRPFDLVLWATGHAALPYLENGPVISSESWQAWQRVFEGDFLLFAAYFN
jgi:hypothetical protein